jgi:hypothetical protein
VQQFFATVTHPTLGLPYKNVGYTPMRGLVALQRLVVVRRLVHGNQRVLSHRLEVSQPHSRKRMLVDRFGNVVFEISIPKVEVAVDFDVSLIVERFTGQGPHLEAATRQALDVYLQPSALTRPDTALRTVAAKLACRGEKGADLASSSGGTHGDPQQSSPMPAM